MKIAVHTTELEMDRIDGTRVYISALLREFAKDDTHRYGLYHHSDFNPAFHVPQCAHFRDYRLSPGAMWTQSRFARALWQDRPDVLWMPFHNLPVVRPRGMKTVVTIHDLAFKFFPGTFLARDVRRLNWCTDYAVTHADHLIAVSQSTKDDLIAYYGEAYADKITVIHHGFDRSVWEESVTQDDHARIRADYGIADAPYVIYTGAIQPRKNLERVIDAFTQIKKECPTYKLVLAGKDAWQSEGIHRAARHSHHRTDILFTGGVSFADLRTLVAGADVYLYPSLYEGFGIPILEAFAAGTPVVTADNSSLGEVSGGAASLCNAQDVDDIARATLDVITEPSYAAELVQKGKIRAAEFTWERSAQMTQEVFEDLKMS